MIMLSSRILLVNKVELDSKLCGYIRTRDLKAIYEKRQQAYYNIAAYQKKVMKEMAQALLLLRLCAQLYSPKPYYGNLGKSKLSPSATLFLSQLPNWVAGDLVNHEFCELVFLPGSGGSSFELLRGAITDIIETGSDCIFDDIVFVLVKTIIGSLCSVFGILVSFDDSDIFWSCDIIVWTTYCCGDWKCLIGMEEENEDNATQNGKHPVDSIPNEAIISDLVRGIEVPLKIDNATLSSNFCHFAWVLVDVDLTSFISETLLLETEDSCIEDNTMGKGVQTVPSEMGVVHRSDTVIALNDTFDNLDDELPLEEDRVLKDLLGGQVLHLEGSTSAGQNNKDKFMNLYNPVVAFNAAQQNLDLVASDQSVSKESRVDQQN
ncbi:hypothetical protein FNV43_RR27264 [Rhamnella rubrinervis]|uniref:Uncharacterized protein n=1 Tax=Rhamnella rubrinervis TaxID=2594499 RepID=A0A8K0DQQ2_9ROSA|nr:hypothetical protein FNV43_RR27264 [Rhamnella rubrinervis]